MITMIKFSKTTINKKEYNSSCSNVTSEDFSVRMGKNNKLYMYQTATNTKLKTNKADT